MRVAVVTSPRTGSSFCIKLISELLNLENYEEILNEQLYVFEDDSHVRINTNITNEKILEKLLHTNDYVVKIMASELFERNFNVNDFPWSKFDLIILLERDNIFEQITSWYSLNYWQQCVTNTTTSEYNIKDKFLKYTIDCIKKYHIVKDLIIQNRNKFVVIEKENIINDVSVVFDTQVTDDIILRARKKLVPECDLNDIDYEIIMSNQNVKQRVLSILEQELNGTDSN